MTALEQLIQQAIASPQQTTLERLADEILRSRKVGRSAKGQLLAGVHQEIYERARQQLLIELEQAIDRFDAQQISARIWASGLRDRAFSQILDDSQLKRLAIEAQRHSPQTEARQHTLGQLVEAIRLSGKLSRPHQATFSPPFYALIYEEAVNRTLTYVCRSIDRYDPERGEKKFMSWVNFRLDRTILDCRREFNAVTHQELPTLAELETFAQPEPLASPAEQLRDYIERDPDQVLQQSHVKNRPDANFRSIALARFVHERSWADLSAEFGIPIPTLSSFFQRRCQEFIPLFEQHLSD